VDVSEVCRMVVRSLMAEIGPWGVHISREDEHPFRLKMNSRVME